MGSLDNLDFGVFLLCPVILYWGQGQSFTDLNRWTYISGGVRGSRRVSRGRVVSKRVPFYFDPGVGGRGPDPSLV